MTNEKKTKVDMSFGELLSRAIKTDPKEVIEVSKAEMKEDTIDSLIEAFEANAQHTDDGIEFWYARDLQQLLEYAKWDKFQNAIEKARTAIVESGNDPEDHLPRVEKVITAGKGAEQRVEDYMLSRYACYLIAQNADARKRPVAFAQTYFAIQARRQEIRDKEEQVIPMSEDEKRVYLRTHIKEHNKYLSSAAKSAGVVTPLEFSIFHSKGYQGLYGKTVPQIRKHKGLSKSTDILDKT